LCGAGGVATAAATFGFSTSAEVPDAKACRSGSLKLAAACGKGSRAPAVCCGSNDASATVATGSLSCLLALLATATLASDEAISGRAAGKLPRPRMPVAAAPTTRKQVSAMMVIALVKQFSVSFRTTRHIAENWAIIKA
jgi:hypothetical protein